MTHRVILVVGSQFLRKIVGFLLTSVADPGFPGGANPRGRGANLLFCPFIFENCMNKENLD